jgi:uncharacterized protein
MHSARRLSLRHAVASMTLPAALLFADRADAQRVAGAGLDLPTAASEAARAELLPLWRLSEGGGTVYLMGSVHLLRPEVYPLDEGLYAAFDRSSLVVFEIDLEEAASAGLVMMQRGLYQDGRTLRDVLPSDLYADVETRAAQLGFPALVLERMKPWLVILTFSSLLVQQAGFDAASGIDMHFHQRAREAGKEIAGLETVERQIAAFEGMGVQGQIASLRQTVDRFEDAAADMDRATLLWKRGDVQGLVELFTASMAAQPELMESLLYERNRDWIPQIESFLRERGTTMVIVGVGHLFGEGSVIELLRDRGYEVTQMRTGAAEAAAGSP